MTLIFERGFKRISFCWHADDADLRTRIFVGTLMTLIFERGFFVGTLMTLIFERGYKRIFFLFFLFFKSVFISAALASALSACYLNPRSIFYPFFI